MVSNPARIFLKPGEIYSGGGLKQVETLLGSCVAVTFWDSKQGMGAMCHYLLPVRPNNRIDAITATEGHYGEDALSSMLTAMLRKGIAKDDITAKIFGGARVFSNETNQNTVGQTNTDFALKRLAELGITVTTQDINGVGYRQLRFDLQTGDVWVKRNFSQLSPSQKEIFQLNQQVIDKVVKP